MFAQLVSSCTVPGYPVRIIAPKGWFLARYDITNCTSTNDVEQAIFWRVADGADASAMPPPYTWKSYYWNSGNDTNEPATGIEAGTIVSYYNVNTTYPIDDHAGWITTSASNLLSASTVYASTNHDVLLVWYGYETAAVNKADTPAGPAGMVRRAYLDNGNATPDLWAGVFEHAVGAAGWTAASVGTIGNSVAGLSVGTSIALLPADADPVTLAPPDPPASGHIYYVDNSAAGCGGSGCSDSDTGTSSSSAWKTIAKVNATTFVSGDRILFRAGDTWREELTPRGSGGPGDPIVYSRFGSGANPVISGANALPDSWVQCTAATCGASSQNVWYQDIGSQYAYVLDTYVTDVSQTCPGAACPALNGDPGWGLMRAADLPAGSGTAPGPVVNPVATVGAAQISAMTAGSWLYYPLNVSGAPADAARGRIYVWLGDSSNPNDHTIEAAVRDHCIGGGAPNLAASNSFVTYRNLTLTHSGTGIAYWGKTVQKARYITVEWSTIHNLGSQVDDGSYYNGITASRGTNWLERHNTIAYTGDHGNSVNNQVNDFAIVEFDDHSHCNHDCGDTKASDLVSYRYNRIHDSAVAPAGSVKTPIGYGGLYTESWSNNGRIDYLGNSVSSYAAIGWEAYFNLIYNFDGGGNRSAVQNDYGIGFGSVIVQNTIYNINGNGIYIGDGATAPDSGGYIANNIIDMIPSSNTVIRDDAAGWFENYNELGLYTDGAPGVVTYGTQGINDMANNPQFVSTTRSSLNLGLQSTSPCLGAGSAGLGGGNWIGALP